MGWNGGKGLMFVAGKQKCTQAERISRILLYLELLWEAKGFLNKLNLLGVLCYLLLFRFNQGSGALFAIVEREGILPYIIN
jgi:hypothetical protein